MKTMPVLNTLVPEPLACRHSTNGRTSVMSKKRRVSPPAMGVVLSFIGATGTRSKRKAVAVAAVSTVPASDPPVLSPAEKKKKKGRKPSGVTASRRQQLARALGTGLLSVDERTEDEDDEYELLEMKPTPRRIVRPDPSLPGEYQGRVSVVEYQGAVYDAMLVRASVPQHSSEFVALQVLQTDDSGEFFVWTRSGHVGVTEQTLLEGPYYTRQEALAQFNALFVSKTLRSWTERDSIGYSEGSFTYIEIDHSSTEEDDSIVAVTATRKRRRSSSSSASRVKTIEQLSVHVDELPSHVRTPGSRLDEDVQSFLLMVTEAAEYEARAMYGVKQSHAKSTRSSSHISVALPLGRLSRATIMRGYDALHQIYDAIKCRADRTMLTHLSSRFYSVVPHSSPLEVIDSMIKLGRRVELLAALAVRLRREDAQSLELTQRLLAKNYLDECYDSLQCRLFPLSTSSHEYQLVDSYIFNSFCCYGTVHATTPSGSTGLSRHCVSNGKILNVFRIEKPSEAQRFEPFRAFPNRRVLWHGSRLGNWLSILTHGLLIKPCGVPHNGSAFGNGIYFTDKITRAMAYSHFSGKPGDRRQVFILSEVALGSCKQIANTSNAALSYVHHTSGGSARGSKAHHSCHGVGRCSSDTTGDYEDAFGAVWPLGKPTPAKEIPTSTLIHNEFVVYNPAQVRMRYIVVATDLGHY
ncbi:hypothetical protein Poli38472_012248 [Pythium oligandrum]|uniref:Poly [ADP-ribose] polymerase n=1 Tax=Pythium oligandrum TaxID=41045 RepID=A0A8K1CP32_PYTOL|nr:hypothetical protein Poli38472_012248 [Pythium oligandrum]|eukprot:TMW67132.1 hypothetical protein Poli38472_012248 [Pythium oligandrum]